MSVEEARPPDAPRFIVGACIDWYTYRNICVVDIKENSNGKYYVFNNGLRQWVKYIDGGIDDANIEKAEYHTPAADPAADPAAGAPAAGGRRRKKRKGSKSKKTKKTKKSRKSRKSRKSKK